MSQTKTEVFKEVISHFDYHWFWGLNYHEVVPANNLAVEVDALITDIKLQKALRLKLLPILLFEYSIVIFFHWLFNINNFRVDIYTWAACIAYNEFALTKEKQPIHFGLEESGWDLGAIKWFRTELNKNPGPFKDENQNTIHTTSTTADDLNLEFCVKASMQPHLNTLEIIRRNGEFLGWEEIRKAFKKKALLVHPDKNNNTPQSNEAFKELGEAVDYFKSLLRSKNNPSDLFNDRRMDDIQTGINNLHKGYEEIREMNAETREMNAETREMNAETREMNAETREMQKEIKRHIDRIILDRANKERLNAETCRDTLSIEEIDLESCSDNDKQKMYVVTDTVIDIDSRENSNPDYSTCQFTSSEKRRSSDSSNEMSSLLVAKGLYAIKTSPKPDLEITKNSYEGNGFEFI